MFKKKKAAPEIDQDQLELIQNAQKRVKQKKRLYIHFVVFLIGAVFIIASNTVLGIGKDYKILGKEWFLFAILLWLFFLAYHTFNVFVTNKFMGKAWEQKQLNKLVTQQQVRIERIKKELEKEASHIAQSDLYNESLKAPAIITVIGAAAENNVIGKDNKLIWHLSDDLKRFKTLTNGHHIIMGRKTFESFPKPLPNRTHIVITRQTDYQIPEGVIIVNNMKSAIKAAKNDPQPFIIGGGEIYKEALFLADRIELTRVHESFEGDAFFPEIDLNTWKVINESFHEKDKTHKHDFSFLTYERK